MLCTIFLTPIIFSVVILLILFQWNLDGSFLASGSYDKSCKIASFDPQGGLKVCHVVNCSSPPSQVSWHPVERNRFALGGDDVSIDLWDVRAPKAALRLSSLGHNLQMSWSPNGKFLAVANKSDQVVIFDIAAGAQMTNAKFSYEVRTAHIYFT